MSQHARAIDILGEKLSHYNREISRFTNQANLRQRQLDERGSEGKDLKFIQQLLANDEASLEKYSEWAGQLRASITILTEAEGAGE